MQVLSIKENGVWVDLAVSESRKFIIEMYKKLKKEYHTKGKKVVVKIEKRV